MPEQRAKRRPIQTEPGHKQSCGLFVPGEGQGLLALAQSTAIAQAMASIRNLERGVVWRDEQA